MVSPSLSTTRRGVLGFSAVALLGVAPRAASAAPEGELRIGSHVSLAPTWFDPAETSGIITPFMMLYAMHDAMMKAMPGNPMAPCLAEAWTMSPDGLSYAFTLRKGVLFHNGEALTAEGLTDETVRSLLGHAGEELDAVLVRMCASGQAPPAADRAARKAASAGVGASGKG